MVRSILWGNCNGEARVMSGGNVTFECSIADSTGFLHDGGTFTYSGENWFTDPLFCDPAPCGSEWPKIVGDLTVHASSPALLAPCGPIGAFGEGCSTLSIEPSSWGRIKGIYRLK
jgi:hypothetical protein